MKLIAQQTIHGKKTIRARDRKVKDDKGEYEDRVIAPGTEFDTAELGISDEEAEGLIKSKAAKRKVREVADDGDRKAPAEK